MEKDILKSETPHLSSRLMAQILSVSSHVSVLKSHISVAGVSSQQSDSRVSGSRSQLSGRPKAYDLKPNI